MAIILENYYEYVNEESIDKYLICDICQKPLIQPVISRKGSIHCTQCVENSADAHSFRSTSSNESQFILFTDQSVLENLNKLMVKCKLCCKIDIERAHFHKHIHEICQKAVITCSTIENNCSWIGLREDFEEHLKNCSYQLSIKNHDQQIEEKRGEFFSDSHINLQRRFFHHQYIADAAKALIINKRLTFLDISNKCITSEDSWTIASVLHDDMSLEIISLRNNFICDSGIQYFARSLSTNSCLKVLDLNENAITDVGVQLLAEMLKTNQTLIKLTLSYNRITNDAIDTLSDVLINSNSTLKWLSLAGNKAIDNSSTSSIINLIRNNQSLTTLNLEDCQISWLHQQRIFFFQLLFFKSKLELLL